MPGKMISAPSLPWGGPPGVANAAGNDQNVIEAVNGDTVTLYVGDVVVVAADGFTVVRTTTANDKATLGVITTGTSTPSGSVPVGAPCFVAVGGVARVNIGGNTVAANDILAASTTTRVAVTNNAATVGQAIAIAREANGAGVNNDNGQNTVRAIIQKS